MTVRAPRPPVQHRERLRIYWEDTDAGGVVYYANYLRFFERARTEWLRALGFGQQRMREADGLVFVVAHSAVSYLRPARLDDEITVDVALREAGRASLLLQQQAWRGDELLADGEIRIGCVRIDERTGTFRPQRIPTPLLERIAAAGVAGTNDDIPR